MSVEISFYIKTDQDKVFGVYSLGLNLPPKTMLAVSG